MPSKKYKVVLESDERASLHSLISRGKVAAYKRTHAQILLKADADGPGWTDNRIAEAFGCRRQTVEKIRQRFVEYGFEETLDGKKRDKPPTGKQLSGEQEAKIIATRLGPPPKGYANWTLRLLARQVVALEIVEAVSYETVRRTLKKTA